MKLTFSLSVLVVVVNAQKSATLTFWNDISLSQMCTHITDSYNSSTDYILPYETCDLNGLKCMSSGPASAVASMIYCAQPYNDTTNDIESCLDSPTGYFFLTNNDSAKVSGNVEKNMYNRVQYQCSSSSYCSCNIGQAFSSRPPIYGAYGCSEFPQGSGCCTSSAFTENMCMFNLAFTAWKYGNLWRNAQVANVVYTMYIPPHVYSNPPPRSIAGEIVGGIFVYICFVGSVYIVYMYIVKSNGYDCLKKVAKEDKSHAAHPTKVSVSVNQGSQQMEEKDESHAHEQTPLSPKAGSSSCFPPFFRNFMNAKTKAPDSHVQMT
jgi:hypothetical protein